MTPDQLAAMQADMQDGTPGDWGAKCGTYDGMEVWEFFFHQRQRQELSDVFGCVFAFGRPHAQANASRIARVPLMEATIIAQAAEIARLRAALGNAQYGLSWAVRYFKDQDVAKDDPCPPCTRGLSATRAALEPKP